MDIDITLLWVLLIVVIGAALSVYSLCKGCRGLANRERGLTARDLVAPYANFMQQLRAEAAIANRARLFAISGQAVRDKEPPKYEELFAPPPTYEEIESHMNRDSSEKPGTSTNSERHRYSTDRPLAVSTPAHISLDFEQENNNSGDKLYERHNTDSSSTMVGDYWSNSKVDIVGATEPSNNNTVTPDTEGFQLSSANSTAVDSKIVLNKCEQPVVSNRVNDELAQVFIDVTKT